jgi:hypothetical protein
MNQRKRHRTMINLTDSPTAVHSPITKGHSQNKENKNVQRIPVSTYRLQMHSRFGFSDARAILPYLSRLGITDGYTSPFLKARPGSTHGYDIINHNVLNPELGSESDYEQFSLSLKEKGMGHLPLLLVILILIGLP